MVYLIIFAFYTNYLVLYLANNTNINKVTKLNNIQSQFKNKLKKLIKRKNKCEFVTIQQLPKSSGSGQLSTSLSISTTFRFPGFSKRHCLFTLPLCMVLKDFHNFGNLLLVLPDCNVTLYELQIFISNLILLSFCHQKLSSSFRKKHCFLDRLSSKFATYSSKDFG